MSDLKEIIIDGSKFSDVAGFYDEIERQLTHELDWRIGRNLNALNDVLRGGFGVHQYGEPIALTWLHSNKSKADLGPEATIAQWENALYRAESHQRDWLLQELDQLRKGAGKTLYASIRAVIQSHSQIEFVEG